ncbi:MAG TPA: TIGR03118 family protein [Actinomycetota bacterium]|nr:TIGR03118 family protein [Actinomycetota bacterium]
MARRLSALFVVPVLILLLAAPGSAAGHTPGDVYHRTKLVADEAGAAQSQDPNLVNAWGLAAGPGTPWWVADNEPSLSTLYDGAGVRQGLVVSVPGAPTGLVFNGGPGFVVNDGMGHSGAALFLFSTESGAIFGWNPAVPPPPPSTQAQLAKDRSDVGAIYKGLAIDPEAGRLYATDFHNARVDVFDTSFGLVNLGPGAFTDPKLPADFAPFGIQDIGGTVFVTYAKQDADAEDEVDANSLGFVDAYDTDGMLLGRVATRGLLNAPWGLAMAPAEGFGGFSGDLLVGNFGNGQINAYAQRPNGTWKHDGRMRTDSGKPLTVDGLWALQFGQGPRSGSPTTLFFTAGPDHESHGLFGTIEAGA